MRTLTLLPLLVACSQEIGLTQKPTDPADVAPAVVVEPSLLDFGPLLVGEARQDEVRVRNEGSGDLTLSAADLAGAGSFELLGALPPTLAPGEEIALNLVFTAPDGEAAAWLAISSDDPLQPVVTVDLLGQGVPEGEAEGGLVITPQPLDFGGVWVGCEQLETLELTAVGGESTVVTALDFEGDSAFAWASRSALPIELAPGDTLLVDVSYAPESEGPASARLTAATSRGENGVEISGEGRYAGETTQEFTVSGGGQVDLLFIVDQSSSMDPFQAELNRNFEDFIRDLESYTTGWQLIVANADDGCAASGILDASTPGYVDTFTRAVGQGSGVSIGGHPTRPDQEALLTIAANAAERSAPGQCNEGFLRPGALLHAILVSDEHDQSANPWWSYVDRMRTTRDGDPSRVIISAFVDSSWDNDEGYREAVAETEGIQAPITAGSWAPFMPSLAARSVPDVRFTLESDADADTLVVRHNGVELAEEAWTWFPATREVVVHAELAALATGDQVAITYDQLATCE